tara:strand:- start:705 stop:1562 length:858 start_codon:yes stop_codon:yes gene_type:complete
MNFNKDNFISSKVYISWLGSVYIKSSKEDFIRAIKSIEWQDYKYKQEIIIVKDGPISNELEDLIDNYFYKLNHKIISTEYNQGLGNALRLGSKNCIGKYIARFDTDDINLPNRLSTQIPIIENDSNIALVSSAVLEKSHSEKIFYKKNYKRNGIEMIYKFNPINHPTVIINKDILIKVGNYENVKYFEDYYLWLKILKEGYKIHLINTPLVVMNIDDQYRKRWGIRYLLYEFIFTRKIIKNKLIKRKYIFYLILRIISRLILLPAFQKKIRKNRRTITNFKLPEL